MVLALVLAGCSGAAEEDARSGDDTTTADGTSTGGEDDDGDSDVVEIEDREPAEDGSWTYLVYSMADNDLEGFLLEDVLEMSEVGSGDGLNIVALVDRAEGYAEGPLANLDDWETAKLLHVLEGEFDELGDLGEIDMGDPAELVRFIEYGVTNFPADHYALTISDHGGGYVGMGPDESSGELLDLAQLSQALEGGLEAAGLDRFDIIGYDACLMATYEVANGMQPYADYMLASEELEPGHGWDYRALAAVREDPATTPEALGVAFVDSFAGQAAEQGTELDITLSLVDLNQMAALDDAMAVFAGQLTDQVDVLAPLIGRQRQAGLEFNPQPDPQQSLNLIDLGAFVAEIGVASLQVSDAADAVLRAINDAVVHQTVGPARLGSTGLSIYFPQFPQFFDAGYAPVTQAIPWLQFLEAYHGVGSAIPVEAQPALATDDAGDDLQAVIEEDEDGIFVSIQLDPSTIDNIASASLSFGYVDPEDGAIVQLGDTEADIFDDGTVSGFTDLTVLTISDGEDVIDAYLSLTFDEEAGLSYANVPLEYTLPDGSETSDVTLSIVVDSETGDVLQETYYINNEGGTLGELSADPDALISPIVLVYGIEPGGVWEAYGESALFADLPALEYDFAELESGTEIYVDIVVTDFGGNQAIGATTFTLS
ncbi:hypothetical protein BH23ACT9_BH23ACT9_25740 [soil metagenome]